MSDRPQRIWAWETNEVTQVSPPTVRIRNIWGSPYSAPDDATEYIRADLALPAVQPVTGEPVTLTYTNWRRETAQRTIVPQRVWFGSTDWHPEPQWLLTALDTEKGAERDFALKDFGRPAVQPDAREADAADAPVWYSSEQADAWASGYNAALALHVSQPDAGTIWNAAIHEAADLISRGQLHTIRERVQAILALIDKPGKEVSDPGRNAPPADAAPAGLSAGGGAEPATIREAALREAIAAVKQRACEHDGEDDYSRGMDVGAWGQNQIDIQAIVALIDKPGKDNSHE